MSETARMRAHATRVLDEALPELHGIYAREPRRVDRATFERGPRLEVVFMPGSGFDTVDLAAATEHNVACINSAGVNATPVSDCAVGLMISASMRTGYVDRFMHREKRWIFHADLDEHGRYPGPDLGEDGGDRWLLLHRLQGGAKVPGGLPHARSGVRPLLRHDGGGAAGGHARRQPGGHYQMVG
jgi:lactate dehydrogenase-like 2-hydroxyacid dehydrogenase